MYRAGRIVLRRSVSDVRRKATMSRVIALCPECEAEIDLQNTIVGEIVFCPDCNAELEVTSLEQPALALAPRVEEDWGE
jgi:alpha-aminoadipate carrier protein LysW